jgi:uncharacterized protein YndB with AHSA1/START domain
MSEIKRGATGRGGEEKTPGAPEGRSVEASVWLAASPERVWRALTDAAELERWFPLEAAVEPGEGGSIWLSWKNEFASSLEIVAWEPVRHLRTGWRFHEHDRDLQVTDYWLEGEGEGTRLRVVTSGFPADASWDEWIEGTARGWRFELRSLEEYLTHHQGMERHVLYLRTRVPLAPEEVWARLFGPDGLGERPLGGRPFDVASPRQYAAVVDQPAGALLRASVEPTAMRGAERDVTLWLQAWGRRPPLLDQLQEAWSDLLARRFPEGSAL